MRIWLTPLGKPPRPTETICEGKGNSEYNVGKGVEEYQFRPCDKGSVGHVIHHTIFSFKIAPMGEKKKKGLLIG